MEMETPLSQFLAEDSFGIFLLVSGVMGGGAAWLSGRAIAATWRPWWQVIAYMLMLGATLLSPYYYAIDSLVALLFGLLGFRVTRAAQMATQYGFLHVRTGPLSWARRAAATVGEDTKS